MFDQKQYHLEYDKKYYQKNKQKRKLQVSVQDKMRQEKYRNFIWNYLLQHPCVDCGETDPIVLQFDHQRDKTDSVSRMVYRRRSLEAIEDEISKCEVRCANCHFRKTADDLGWYKLQRTIQ